MPPRPTPSRLVLLTALLAPAVLAQTTLTMRAGTPTPPGEVTGVDAQGITLSLTGPAPAAGGKPSPKSAPAMTTILSWDRVAAVQGDLAARAAPFLAIGEKLWRARTRLDRAD